MQALSFVIMIVEVIPYTWSLWNPQNVVVIGSVPWFPT